MDDDDPEFFFVQMRRDNNGRRLPVKKERKKERELELGGGGDAEGVSFDGEDGVAVGAVDFGGLAGAVDAEDVAEEDAVLGVAVRAGALGDEGVDEDDLVGEELRQSGDDRRSQQDGNDRIETPGGRHQLVGAAGPDRQRQDRCGRVEQEFAELVFAKRDRTHSRVDETARLLGNGDDRVLFLQRGLQVVELFIRQDRLAPRVGAHGLQELGLLPVQSGVFRTFPRQLFLQQVKVLVAQH
mmetsp:Transcript_6907/g.21382  ORF Transcript_6907/g.21382 Transcript_6907/m.21382 type:complete len:240 (-) Transcript_6907:329-1048(-)